MSVGAITAGEAYVSITCDNSDLIDGLRESSATIGATARKISEAERALTVKVGAAGVDALETALGRVEKAVDRVKNEVSEAASGAAIFASGLFSGIKNAILATSATFGEFGDGFDKMAARTGVSTEALSEYAHAASMCGAELSNVEGAFKGMASYLDDAANGGGDAIETFRRLGLSVETLSGLSPEEQFDAIARAVAGIADPTTRAALAMKVFGDDGQMLLPLFSSGAEGLSAMRDEARKLGVSLSGDAASGAAAYVDATTRLKSSVQGAGLMFAELFAPVVTQTTNAVAKFVSFLSRLAREFPNVATSATIFATAAASVGAGFVAWTTVAPTVVGALSKINAAIRVFSAHPIVACAVAVAALTAACVAFYKTRSAASGPKWSEDAADALAAGDALRAQDEQRLARLEELSKKQKLTASEISEAVELAADLKSRYGDVGIEVDALTGKIKLANDAQAKFNRLQLQTKASEVAAALAEAEANGQDGVIEKKIAGEEVSFAERAIGKKRGEGWFDWITHYDSRKTDAEANVAIVANDPQVQAQIAAAKKANAARVASLRAQSEALSTMLNGGAAATGTPGAESETSETSEANAKLDDELTAFFADAEKADLSPLDKKIAEINERGEKMKDAIRAALDPNGVVDWTDANSVAAFANSNPAAYAEASATIDRIDATTAARSSSARDAEAADARKKADEKRRKAEEDAARKIESARKAVDDFETKRADDGKTAIEKKIDAIDRETDAYRTQLKTLRDLEAARANPDAAKVAELDVKIQKVDDDANERKDAALQEAQEAYFDKFATPSEKFEQASRELAAAFDDLKTAQANGDETIVAAALEKLGDARTTYEAASSATQKAVESVESKTRPESVGTFSAFQAAAFGADGYRRLVEETREQTRILKRIERKTSTSAPTATFGD